MATLTVPTRVLNIDTLEEARLFAKTGATSRHESSEAIAKIVIGPSPDHEQNKATRWSLNLGHIEWDRFPSLTHLYLWSLDDLKELRALPATLQVLDVRGCRHLTTIHPLPAVKDFVADDCEALVALRGIDAWKASELADLSMRRCEAMPSDALEEVLTKANDTIEKLDLSKTQLVHLRAWPPRARSIILNDCHDLRTVPEDDFPASLTRFEVARTRLIAIPKLTANLDYVNLAGIRERAGIDRLEKDWKKNPTTHHTPRTLFLHDSGLLQPPASEHGEDAGDNVAMAVREFFEDIDLAGARTSNRCKVIFLGNGGAGKTSLCELLCKRSPEHGLGSTHGVRLEMQPRTIKRNDGRKSPINIDYWDFGGQDLYHNVHRMFTSTGSVFILLWNPDCDTLRSDENSGPYHDTPRSLTYWIELIKTSTRSNPKLLVVCQGKGKHTAQEEMKIKFRQEVTRDRIGDDRFFVIDTWQAHRNQPNAEFHRFEKMLNQFLLDVVASEGDQIPAHWVLARESADALRKGGKRFCTIDVFEQTLRTRIDTELAKPASQYGELKQTWKKGFELNPQRVRRALMHLSHTGSLFWHSSLEEPTLATGSQSALQSVILDQKPALDGVYALLERGETVYAILEEAKGRFTAEQLNTWCWHNRAYNDEQQAVLLRYMERLGTCFPLISAADASRGEAVYVSVEHLPKAKIALREQFERLAKDQSRRKGDVEIRGPFSLGWKQLLAFLGKQYGRAATYASDAFLFAGPGSGHAVLITSQPKGDSDIDGTLRIEICGGERGSTHGRNDAQPGHSIDKRLKDLQATLSVIADPKTSQRQRDQKADGPKVAGEPATRTLFVSYAWNPTPNLTDYDPSNDPLPSPVDHDDDDLESPIDDIERAIRERSPYTKVIRDKHFLMEGQDISEFMRQIGRADVVLVFHSDRYWKRPFCMYELRQLFVPNQHQRILYVGHTSCQASDDEHWGLYEEYWNNHKDDPLPPALKGKITAEGLHAFVNYSWWSDIWPNLFRNKGKPPSQVWHPDTKDRIIDQLIEILDPPTA